MATVDFVDPHSYAFASQPLTSHISLSLYFDFPSSTIHGTALLTLSDEHNGSFFLDTRSLTVHQVLDAQTLASLPFSLSPTVDPIKGQRLDVTLNNHRAFVILFSTSPSSSALQWLSPPQTFNKIHPFVYTQCQAIHARSIFPCQDTPGARICYKASLNIPCQLSAVMAAQHVDRRAPVPGETEKFGSNCFNFDIESLWCAEGRVVEVFEMNQPIPPYLFAFAVGELGFREVGPRTRVYAESVPAVLDAAAREFAGTEEMIRQVIIIMSNIKFFII